MTTFAQLLLVVVVTTLTFLVSFAAIQVFHILHEFRLTLKRLNRIIENTSTISESAAKPITAVNEFFTGVKELVDTTQDQIISETPDRVVTSVTKHSVSQSSRRFFRRSGLPLRPS